MEVECLGCVVVLKDLRKVNHSVPAVKWASE